MKSAAAGQVLAHLLGWAILLLPVVAHAELTLGILPGEPAPTIARVLASLDADGEALALIPFSNADELLAAMQSGSLDAALLEQPMAPTPGISRIAELYPSVLHILYSQELAPAGLDSLLLAGPVYAGAPGGAGDRLVTALAGDYGLPSGSLQVVSNVLAEDPEVYFVFGGLLAPDALQRLDGFRLWSMDDIESLMHGSVAESLMLRYPNLRPFVLPADLYPTLARSPALTVAVPTLLVARDDLALDRAYALAALSERAKPLVSAVYPLAGLPHLRSTEEEGGSMLPLHPGAQRFVDRNEPGLLERYSEIMALVISVLVALGSVLVAWRRRRRQAKKDRLDSYFRAVMAARPAAAATADQRAAACNELKSIQSEVLELVIAERIEADGALVAFLSISNQALAESLPG